MGTKPELGEADKAGAPMPLAMYFHVPGLTPGTTYYWRVDEIAADGTVIDGPGLELHRDAPGGALPVTGRQGRRTSRRPAQLKWTAGQGAVGQMLFLGTDKTAVETGAPSAQVAAGPDVKYDFTGLNPFTTYYWRVDEIGGTGQIVPGPVWSFSTVSYLSMADAAVTLNYNNSASPFTSQVTLTGAADWTAYGLSDLVVQFTGRAGPKGGLTYDEPTQTYSLAGSGTDIWNNGDQFHYAFKSLSGDGTMIARVTNIGAGANTWAKGGVMIRQSLAAGSTHAYMPITANSDGTAGNGASFQRRLAADGASSNNDSTTKVAPPYWVKIERKGNDFSGSISPDGQTWTQLGTAQTIAMTDPVYIGLAVTSHVDAATLRTFTFDSVGTTGNVTPAGPFSAWDDIGIGSNDPQPIYAAVEDKAGKIAVVNFGDPAATQITQPWTWKIPLTSFAGVDLKNVAKLYLGAGDLLSPAAGGSGAVTFSSVRVVRPVVLVKGADVTMPGDNVLGVPNNGNWPAAETPWLVIDDKSSTKFLHFSGKTDPVGFQVQVLAGPTVVTGMTLTTANDAAERDPVAFELSGSNDGFQGPWTLIAKGDIVDFAGATAAARFTKNTTPITFENKVAYKFYQVLFTPVRDPVAANSMQIAEVELINGGPNVIWVSDAYDDKPDAVRDDQSWIDFLTAQGFNVDYRMVAPGNGYWRTLDQAKIDALNAADLIIVSRNLNSGDYTNGTETTQWNGVTTPLLSLAMHQLRSSHWKWFNTTTINATVPALKPVDATNPAFAGVTLDANGQVQALAAGMSSSFPGLTNAGNGTVLATRADTGDVWIASWAAGTEFYAGAAQTAAGPRVFFAGATQEVIPTIGRGELNLTDSGQAVFLNVVDLLLGRLEVPAEQPSYTYEGDLAANGTGETTEAGTSLDGTWSSNNGSDAWDGSAPGAGAPGGVVALVEDSVTFLRIQDTGNPTKHGTVEPSNRKLYFQHPIAVGLDGAHLEVRLRVATTGVLDPFNPDTSDPVTPWPAAGVGYHIRDDGKGMVGIAQPGVGIISFSLAKAGQADFPTATTDLLVMNGLVGTTASADVDTGVAAAVANTMAIADATLWNTIVIDITAGGKGTHVVTVSVNGGAPQSFDVTAGVGTNGTVNYIALGSSGTTPSTAFDVDYFRVNE